MTQPPDDQDIDAVLQRMRQEFGPRRTSDDDGATEPVPDSGRSQPPPGFGLPARQFVEPATPPPPTGTPLRLTMSTDRPIAVYVLVGINVLVYLISLGLTYAAGRAGTLGTPDGLVLRALGWKENHLIAAGQYWRLITATFLHGSTVHILFNGYALWALGPETERIYGSGRFLALYFLSGLAGSIASYALSSANSVGASGAIFGLFGALLAFYYVNRGLLGGLAQGQIQSMGSVIVFNLIIGFVVPGVDYYAHLGGLAAGTLSGWMLAPRFSVNRMRYPPAVERTTWLPGWAGAAGLALLLVALALIIVPPLPL